VWQALYDGPVDRRDYDQQAVILTKLPTLGDGAAAKTAVVEAGDRVLAASGSVMELAPGVTIVDAEGRRRTFEGEPILMEHMVVTFTLRSGIRWSDGQPLTAEDSVYAFELDADNATPTDKQIIDLTADYRAVGKHQVVWWSVPGFLDRTYRLTFWHPLPRHAWESLSAADLLSARRSTREPLGWGPFAVREWAPGNAITLERNPFYFRISEGLPRVDVVVFRFVSDGEELAEGLRSGACDVVTHEASAALDPDGLSAAPTVRSFTTAERSWELLAFGITPAADYQRPDFFEDVRVRRAIAHCVDRKGLADAAFTGDGRVLHSYLPPEHPAFAGEELTRWSYDPEAGKHLLAQAGWYDENGDGIREAHGVPGVADGTPYQVTYRTTEDPLRVHTAAQVEAQLEACGISVSLETGPPETLFASGPEGELFGRRFDMAQFAWRFTAEPLCDAFLSSQIPGPGDWNRPNVAGFIDGGYDDACREALEALPGSPDYVARHAAPQRIFSERLPVLPLFQHQKTTLAREGVTGLSPNQSQASELWNLEQIDVRR
jgi:peptide/nickel transport system substrate-binding protein